MITPQTFNDAMAQVNAKFKQLQEQLTALEKKYEELKRGEPQLNQGGNQRKSPVRGKSTKE